jgi:hypothetical protein
MKDKRQRMVNGGFTGNLSLNEIEPVAGIFSRADQSTLPARLNPFHRRLAQ